MFAISNIEVIASRKSNLALTILLIIIINLLYYGFYSYKKHTAEINLENQIKQTVTIFINSIVENDWPKAESLSVGKARWTLIDRKEQVKSIKPARIENVDVKVDARGDMWAKTSVVIDEQLADGDWNTLWYDVELINAGTWYVSRVELSRPIIQSGGRPDSEVLESVKSDMKTVLTAYLNELIKGSVKESSKYLSGQARVNNDMSSAVLGKAPLFKEISEVEILPDWVKENDAVTFAKYTVEGRKNMVLVKFHKNAGGWQITDISNVSIGFN